MKLNLTTILAHKKKIIAGLFLLFICFVCLKTCTKKNAPWSESPLLSVTVVAPKMKDIPSIVEGHGNIQAWQETIITPEISGVDITEVYVNVGDVVHKGEKLAKVNTQQVEEEMTQLIANKTEAQAHFEQAQNEARQAIFLEKAGAVSKQELLAYTTKAKSSEAKLASAKAALKLHELKQNSTLITAPDDGIISSRNAAVGSVVQSGIELFRLVRGNRLEWQAQVSPEEIHKIKPGQKVDIAIDGKSIIGKVRQISPSLNQTTRNGMVYVDLPQSTALKLGTYTAGSIYTHKTFSMVVPVNALIHRDGYDYVMCVDKKQRIHQTKVQTGTYFKEEVVILSGLQLSDNIVTVGAGFLNENDLVAIVSGDVAA